MQNLAQPINPCKMPPLPDDIGTPPFPPEPTEVQPQPIVSTTNPFYETESLIMRELILHGEEKAAEGEDEEGNPVAINVADFIRYCMEQDGLKFHTLLFNGILEEVSDQLHENPELRVEAYLLSHQDSAISSLAAELATERYTLSKLFTEVDNDLPTRMMHLITDLKLRIIETELKETQKKLLDPSLKNDAEQLRTVLHRLQELINLKKLLAKEAGDRIFST